MQIYRLTYVSTAATGVGGAALDDILATAQRRNAQADITGLLAFNGSNFMQTLEGPRANVEALMDAICRDSRHTGVVVIATEQASQRAFSSWAMEVMTLSAPPLGDIHSNGFSRARMPLSLPEQLAAMYASFTSLGLAGA